MTMPIYDTRRVQIAVLCEHMSDTHDLIFCGDGFVESGVPRPRFVSFNNAVKLFNEAKENKECGTKLKLVYSKRKKTISCTGHILQFNKNERMSDQNIETFIKGLRHLSSGKQVRPNSCKQKDNTYQVSDK